MMHSPPRWLSRRGGGDSKKGRAPQAGPRLEWRDIFHDIVEGSDYQLLAQTATADARRGWVRHELLERENEQERQRFWCSYDGLIFLLY
jgi:hypothetical protein